jgi:(2R)-sulfolactate sulfo-lyase subunit alpha
MRGAMSSPNSSSPGFLAHRKGDSVAVAVTDLPPGESRGGYLQDSDDLRIELKDAVPLGHKFALVDIADGADVIEYGQRVAVASTAIKRGEHVHVHNVRSARWQTSVAH